MADDRIDIPPDLVRRLIAGQFPGWAHLPIAPVQAAGWDNRTFRLGDGMKIRLPSAERYVAQVAKEHRWLPELAPRLPLPVPVPLAVGAPGEGYPWPWSVQRWLGGEMAARAAIADQRRFARDLARFLLALQRVPADGPGAGPHSFFRGGALHHYDGETRRSLEALHGRIDTAAAAATWQAALAAPWHGPAVWVHGDIAAGNLLVEGGRLSGVIDFGCCAVGDPACDLVIAWTFLEGEGREAFRATLSADAATWARARGWALWKALIVLAVAPETSPTVAPARRVVADVLAEHRQGAC